MPNLAPIRFLYLLGSLFVLWSMTAASLSHAAPLAWQVSQAYQADTLEGGANAKAWSPKSGRQTGKIVLSGGTRYTQIGVQNLAWSQARIDWMKAQWAGQPAPTFHAYKWDNSCTPWQAHQGDFYIGSSFPNPDPQIVSRNGCTNNEIRVRVDENRLVANREEWVQVVYWDEQFRSQAKMVVDTYWINVTGQENYHQHYCISNQNDTPTDRNSC